jgi:polar amino acid transport system substrate-binding protein
VAYTALDQSARRGDFDLGLSGIEDRPGRRSSLAVSVPYYEFREVLTVRPEDASRFRALSDLRGHKIATLSGTLAYDLLLAAETAEGVRAVSYDDDVHPYEDLALGRVDAVLLDHVLAERAMRRDPRLVTLPEAIAVGRYVVISAPSNTALMKRVDSILRSAMEDGSIERIYRTWGVWNADQPRLFASVRGDSQAAPVGPADRNEGHAVSLGRVVRYAPALVKGALLTLVLSFASMALAVGIGAGIAVGRIYGGGIARGALTTYVEAIRGTPVLLQLFVIYYGLASVIRLPAFVAAVLGLALNYAAYESEIYRNALQAVPKGQLDAAKLLGLTRWQTLRLVRAPQAFRLALAPMTNDFVALLKDSSLVSVLTVVELTKQTQILATNIGSWLLPGLLCAALYLAMSLPLGLLARRLEARWRMATL